METLAVILNEVYQDAFVFSMWQVLNQNAMKKMIRRRCNAVEVAPQQPVSRASLIVPEQYTTYRNGERFLLYNSGVGDDGRILIFGRQWYSRWSSEMKIAYADGTFNIAPPLFAQVYMLLADRQGFVVPIMYALLPSKQEDTYQRIFEAVKTAWPQFFPDSISMDFEKATMNAATAVNPPCGNLRVLLPSYTLKRSTYTCPACCPDCPLLQSANVKAVRCRAACTCRAQIAQQLAFGLRAFKQAQPHGRQLFSNHLTRQLVDCTDLQLRNDV